MAAGAQAEPMARCVVQREEEAHARCQRQQRHPGVWTTAEPLYERGKGDPEEVGEAFDGDVITEVEADPMPIGPVLRVAKADVGIVAHEPKRERPSQPRHSDRQT